MDQDALLVLLTDVDVSHGFNEQLKAAHTCEDDIPGIETDLAAIIDDHRHIFISCHSGRTHTVSHQSCGEQDKDNHTKEYDFV